MAWLTGWSYRKEITVQDTNIDGALTDFPVCIKLAADEDIGDEARADGYDIRFTSSDGETLLKYEREYWVGGAGDDATAVFWVKSNLASSGGATIYLYYGKADAGDGEDPTNVWDANFLAVYHMKDITTSTIDDSTTVNDGTKKDANEPIEIAGKIGQAQDFDGSNDNIDLGSDFIGTTAITVSAWIYPTGWGGNSYGRMLENAGLGFFIRDTNDNLGFYSDNSSTQQSTENSIVLNTWQHVCVTRDVNGIADYYIGGSPDNTGLNSGTPANGSNVIIGDRPAGSRAYDGIIDEVRISDIERTGNWIKFEYYNMNEADNELTWGNEEAVGGGAYSLTLDSATITVTGSAMTPLVDRTLGLGAGSYIITGIAIDPLTERALGLDAGEFLLTGTAINMLCEKILDLGTGTYILTGSEIDVLRDAILGLEVGAYIIVGKDVITVYSGGGAVLATMFFIHNF